MTERERLGVEGRRLVGARIRRLRAELTLEDLARRARMSSGTLGRIERGDSDPTLGTLIRLMRALDLRSVEELIGELPAFPSRALPPD